MPSVYLFPFNPKRMRTEGVISAKAFYGWVKRYGRDFYYSLGTAQKGDTFVFSWIQRPGEWIIVGDAKVTNNHMAGRKEGCDCEEMADRGVNRHILTVGLHLYSRPVNTEDLDFEFTLRRFVKLTREQYKALLRKSVK